MHTHATVPDAYSIVHFYTLCPHMSPPQTRPLNVQPVLSFGISTISGRCVDCDQTIRQRREGEILHEFRARLQRVEAQRHEVGEQETERQVSDLIKERDRKVDRAWKGYSRRWGIGLVGRKDDGKMKLAWERPERKRE